jgi:predicted TIM-barrel fold metal-dependent hydrolase
MPVGSASPILQRPRRRTSTRGRIATAALVGLLAAHAAPLAAQQPSPGARPRPGEGRQPEFPPPTILEYTPRSTLVVPAHEVPRAKFPVIDFHGHPPILDSREVIERVVAAMDSLNIRVMVQARGSSGETLRRQIQAVREAGYADRFVFFTNLDLRNVGPGSGAKIAAQLEEDVRAGAVGVGEISKAFGLTYRKTDGTRLRLDDPELDLVWETAARFKVPVFIHVGDPSEFFQPLDYQNERWLELALFPDRRFNDRSRYPSFEELMAERDRLLARHPNTIWVLAHLGWHANDLARLGRIFDAFPNVYAEVGAILYDLGRQPRTAHRFFVKYQDRLLFGKDSFQPDEYPYYWRVFETEDEYFDYYRDYHAFWKLYGMALPDSVLKKVYYANALKIVSGISREGFPE